MSIFTILKQTTLLTIKRQRAMKATHIFTEKFDTRRKLANRALKLSMKMARYNTMMGGIS